MNPCLDVEYCSRNNERKTEVWEKATHDQRLPSMNNLRDETGRTRILYLESQNKRIYQKIAERNWRDKCELGSLSPGIC